MRKRIKQFEHIIDSHFNTIKLSSFILDALNLKASNERQLDFQEKIKTFTNSRKASIIIDIETSTLEFVNVNFVKQHKLNIMILIKFIKFQLTNNKLILNIIRIIQIKFRLSEHVNEI